MLVKVGDSYINPLEVAYLQENTHTDYAEYDEDDNPIGDPILRKKCYVGFANRVIEVKNLGAEEVYKLLYFEKEIK